MTCWLVSLRVLPSAQACGTGRRAEAPSGEPAAGAGTMSLLTGYLPAEQGIACLKSLRDHTDTLKTGGDARCRDQIMADTLVDGSLCKPGRPM